MAFCHFCGLFLQFCPLFLLRWVKTGHPSIWVPARQGFLAAHPVGFFLIRLNFFLFAMAPPLLAKTIDIRCTDFPAGTLSVDVAKYIANFFGPNYLVVSIQQHPGKIARVTFSTEYPKTWFEDGQVLLNVVACTVISPPPPRFTNVIIYWYPYECSNEAVAEKMSKYGTIEDVCYQHWTNLPEIATGKRVVCVWSVILTFHGSSSLMGLGVKCGTRVCLFYVIFAIRMAIRCLLALIRVNAFVVIKVVIWHRTVQIPGARPLIPPQPRLLQVRADNPKATDPNDPPPIIYADDLDAGFEVVVVEEGIVASASVADDVAPVASFDPVVLDNCFNQLDDLAWLSRESVDSLKSWTGN